MGNLDEDEMASLLDYSRYYDKLEMPIPRNRDKVLEARFLRSLLELDGATRINAELEEGLIESMYLYSDGRLEINFGFKEAIEHE